MHRTKVFGRTLGFTRKQGQSYFAFQRTPNNFQYTAFFLLVETHLPFSQKNGTWALGREIWNLLMKWQLLYNFSGCLTLMLYPLQVLSRHYRYYHRYWIVKFWLYPLGDPPGIFFRKANFFSLLNIEPCFLHQG